MVAARELKIVFRAYNYSGKQDQDSATARWAQLVNATSGRAFRPQTHTRWAQIVNATSGRAPRPQTQARWAQIVNATLGRAPRPQTLQTKNTSKKELLGNKTLYR